MNASQRCIEIMRGVKDINIFTHGVSHSLCERKFPNGPVIRAVSQSQGNIGGCPISGPYMCGHYVVDVMI